MPLGAKARRGADVLPGVQPCFFDPLKGAPVVRIEAHIEKRRSWLESDGSWPRRRSYRWRGGSRGRRRKPQANADGSVSHLECLDRQWVFNAQHVCHGVARRDSKGQDHPAKLHERRESLRIANGKERRVDIDSLNPRVEARGRGKENIRTINKFDDEISQGPLVYLDFKLELRCIQFEHALSST